ncbi:Dolichyl-phosphate beta-glucosyltransferase [Zancudomyces culisetae]|uniref:dolichyl-phosphate beta-glucosyltransferase n=1 Tax=Zancudomyces culisetae TaxID=1213189 RepID=A0A1R1PJL5_ZANCU|nr:Dolichyl-phosphate beta-glucosyltransferase [Zancudomyces culisetae]|eukprot:OMH81160.1 Dolichyl-phosphate beta-glucosyltransferase [Zancudomyces culisetae]
MVCLNCVIQYLASVFFVVISFLVSLLHFKTPKPRQRTEAETYYQSSTTKEKKKVDSIFNKPSVFLSIIIPAYNEQERLPVLLNDIYNYLKNRENPKPNEKNHGKSKESPRTPFTYEIILVNDCSSDKTTEIALEFGRKHNLNLKVIVMEINRGKGGSVTQGILSCSGEYVLFCDADGATRFKDIDNLLDRITSENVDKSSGVVAIGTRPIVDSTTIVVQRSFVRKLLQSGFKLYVNILGVRGIDDTQCGFKLFNRTAAKTIFSQLHIERFIFDIEVLLLAQHYRFPIIQVPVNWHEVQGSRMSLVRDSIQMALDLLALRLNYLFGLWKTLPISEIDRR